MNTLPRLRTSITHGIRAPHKPILLLAIMEAYRRNILNSNRIPLSPELVSLFKEIWVQLVVTSHSPNMALPFFHLTGDKFWTLVPKAGVTVMDLLGRKTRNLAQLDAVVDYALIPEQMAAEMMDPLGRARLEQELLRQYFPETMARFKPEMDVPDLTKGLQETMLAGGPGLPAADYEAMVREEDGERLYLRSATFKRLVPQVYNYTCAITGWRITTPGDQSLLDACHIVPFAQSHDDSVTNGIALSPTLHRAFDRGLVTITDEYRVAVSPRIAENDGPVSLRQWHGRMIHLPADARHHPSREALTQHRASWP